MSIQMTIEVSDRLQEQIASFAAADEIDPEEWIRRVLRARVFIRQFRSVRAEMLRDLDDRGIHLTDQDVFDSEHLNTNESELRQSG